MKLLIKVEKKYYFFIIDEHDAKIPPIFFDKGKKQENLDEFKKLIKERHTVATFLDENDLCEKAKLSLDNLLTKKLD